MTQKAFCFLAVLLTGCSGSLSKLKPYQVYDDIATGGGDHVQVTYLGCSGFLFRRGNEAILTDPFFSNPGLVKLALGPIRSKPKRIEAILPQVDDVSAILVAHAHHDHLMDVPYVALTKARKAQVYSSLTGKCILAPSFKEAGAASRLQPIGAAHPPFVPGRWISVSPRIRFMAILSEHAPHIRFAGISAADGSYSIDLARPPTRGTDYRKGRVFSFVIDFVTPQPDGKVEVDFRIYIQSTGGSRYWGFPPDDVQDFDLAILCAANFDRVQEHPRAILERLKPKRLLVSHWEDFFRSPLRNLRTVRLTNIRAFLDEVELVRQRIPEFESWKLPAPGSRVTYPIHN